MRFFLLFILITPLLTNAQLVCKDSSYINTYYLEGEGLITYDRIITKDNGTLLLVSSSNHYHQSIVKLASNGTLQWNKIFTSIALNQHFSITSLLQLKEGNYIIGGVMRYTNDSELKYFALIKLDESGNIIWQHKYKNTYGSSVKDELKLYNISEGDNGDLITYIYQDEDHNMSNGGQCITRFSADGDVMWSNQYFGLGVFVQHGFNIFKNNTLNIWGQTLTNIGCFGKDNNRSTLSCFQLNYATGDMDAIKRFCIQPGKKSVWFYLQQGTSEWITTQQLKNGNTFVFMYYPYINGHTLLINEFDRDNNFLRSKLFSPPDTGATPPNRFYDFDVNNSTGDIVFNFSSAQATYPHKVLPYSFFVYLDSNLNLTQQFYLVNDEPSVLIGSAKFLQNNHLNYVSSSNQAANSQYQQFNYADIPEAITFDAFCNAKDSLFGILSDHGLVPADNNFQWDSIRRNVYALNGNAGLTVSSLPILQTAYCKKISICDTLAIHGSSQNCLSNDTLTYTVYKNPDCFKKINWETDTALAIIVNQPNDTTLKIKIKKAGVFYLHANLEDCVIKDSFKITVLNPKKSFSINKDSLLCPGKTLLLKADEGFANYYWENGANTQNITVTKPGLYKISAVDSCGNLFTDSVFVKDIDTTFSLFQRQSICLEDTLRIALPSGSANIIWQPTVNGTLEKNDLLLFPKQTTKYYISVALQLNCLIHKSIDIQVNICPETIYFPNAFSPNNDGINETFKPVLGRPLQYYRLTIFNRYGQKVFRSDEPSKGWDGRFLNSQPNTETFVYQCIFKFANREIKKIKGFVVLLK